MERGREVIVARDGVPVAKLVPFPVPARRLRVGNWKGKIRIAPDFDAPMTEAELEEGGF